MDILHLLMLHNPNLLLLRERYLPQLNKDYKQLYNLITPRCSDNNSKYETLEKNNIP